MTTTGRRTAIRRALENEFETRLAEQPYMPEMFWGDAVDAVIRAIDHATMDGEERLALAADLLPGATPELLDGWMDQHMSHDDPEMPGRLVWVPNGVAAALTNVAWATHPTITIRPETVTVNEPDPPADVSRCVVCGQAFWDTSLVVEVRTLYVRADGSTHHDRTGRNGSFAHAFQCTPTDTSPTHQEARFL